jgi:hypothetical protein
MLMAVERVFVARHERFSRNSDVANQGKEFHVCLDCSSKCHAIRYESLGLNIIDDGGTRYFSRGIDSNGNVSNFAETEQLLVANDMTYSHIQIRGSVPLFWRQVINVRYQPRLVVDTHPVTACFYFRLR